MAVDKKGVSPTQANSAKPMKRSTHEAASDDTMERRNVKAILSLSSTVFPIFFICFFNFCLNKTVDRKQDKYRIYAGKDVVGHHSVAAWQAFHCPDAERLVYIEQPEKDKREQNLPPGRSSHGAERQQAYPHAHRLVGAGHYGVLAPVALGHRACPCAGHAINYGGSEGDVKDRGGIGAPQV